MKSAEPEGTEGEQAPAPMPGSRGPFGPRFFLHHLTAFVREQCPDPSEGLPVVLLHLMDGEVLELCHVLGLAPDFVALAVNDTERDAESRAMRTEILPYETVHRITVRSVRPAEIHVGFLQDRVPRVIERIVAADPGGPEEALRAAAASPPSGRAPGTRMRHERGAPRRRKEGAGDGHQH